MKTVIAAAFAISAGLSLSTVALAGPFNDRGQDVIANVQSEATTVRPAVADTDAGFNDRGVDYIADAPAGSPAQEPILSLQDKETHRWNS